MRAVINALAARGITCTGTQDSTTIVNQTRGDSLPKVNESATCSIEGDPIGILIYASEEDRTRDEEGFLGNEELPPKPYVVGPAWSVLTDKTATAERVSSAIGGTVKGGSGA